MSLHSSDEQESGATRADRRKRPGKQPVRVGRTPVGKGVFAQQNYRADVVIGEIEGDVIDEPGYGSDYCMSMDDGRHLEPAPPFRYLNHSCEPNCHFDLFDLPDKSSTAPRRRVFLIAIDDIRSGDELTIDYNWSAAGAIPCRCQAETCRGWVVKRSQLAVAIALHARAAAPQAPEPPAA